MVRLAAVEALPGYRLRVTYSDGIVGTVDLSDLVGRGVFAAFKEPGFFQRVSIGGGGEITWDEKVDICADAVYLEVTGKIPEELFPNLATRPSHA